MSVSVTQLKQFIGGEWMDSSSGETIEVLNPATGEVIAEVPAGTAEDVEQAVEAAKKAWSEWRSKTPKDRMELLLALADVIDENAEELARLESQNVGKPWWVAKDEPPAMSDTLRFFAGAARNLEGKSAAEYVEGYTSMIRREPLGIVAGICPWNYPLVHGDVEDRPGARGRERPDRQACRADAVDAASLRRARAGSHPAGCPAGRDRRRHPGGRRARTTSGRSPGLPHRRHGDGEDHRQERRRHRQAPAPRARGQGADGRPRRCRSGHRRGGDQDRSVTSTPARTARHRRGSWSATGSTTTSSPGRWASSTP